MRDTCLSDSRIEVDEEVDPSLQDNFGIEIDETAFTVNGGIRVWIWLAVWRSKGRGCQATEGNQTGDGVASHFGEYREALEHLYDAGA